MRVQHSSYPAIDIPEGAWPVYKAQGYHQVTNPETFTAEVEVRWHAQRGRFVEDYECPPIIVFNATNGTKGFVESTTGTAHKTARVSIPGQKPVTCPESVGQEYLRLFNEWAAKSKRRQSAIEREAELLAGRTVSASTPRNILQAQGVELTKSGGSWAGASGSPWRHDVEFRKDK